VLLDAYYSTKLFPCQGFFSFYVVFVVFLWFAYIIYEKITLCLLTCLIEVNRYCMHTLVRKLK